jgi:hypothetical protein
VDYRHHEANEFYTAQAACELQFQLQFAHVRRRPLKSM